MTDEELGKVAYEEFQQFGGWESFWPLFTDNRRRRWIATAQAVKEAVLKEIGPLTSGGGQADD